MTKVQYSFAQLGESEIFEPYLSSELKKNSDLWKPTEFELPLNDPGLAAAFLTLIQPDAVFYVPRFSGRSFESKSANYLAALSQALETKEALLVSWLQPEESIPPFISCEHLLIRLPEVFYCSSTKNLITDWIDKILSRKRITVSGNKPLRLIGRHLLVQMTVAAALKCLANPGFDGVYQLAANGETSLFELVSFIHSTLARLLPNHKLAKLSFAEEEPVPLSEEFDTSFMENFNVILPGWRTGVEETIVAFLVHRKLF